MGISREERDGKDGGLARTAIRRMSKYPDLENFHLPSLTIHFEVLGNSRVNCEALNDHWNEFLCKGYLSCYDAVDSSKELHTHILMSQQS